MTRERREPRGSAPSPPDAGSPGDAGSLLPGSTCLPPDRFWHAALCGGDAALSESEREHLQTCDRCKAHFAQVLKALGQDQKRP